MRPTFTCLLVIVIASLLVGNAYAECVAMNMPCCAQHSSTNCHEICVAPTGNVSNATGPQFAGVLQPVATIRQVLPILRVIAAHIQPTFALSAENLLLRIHVLLL
ncbi:MAG: hypothetical protein C5B51_02930 [Terriglobia bacterium]|nr:MAG: hypothetical protein C5B51_02930 [Terriglobia bacterium]